MNQPHLFDADRTAPSGLCSYVAPCPRKGRMTVGPEFRRNGAINRDLTCLTCGATGNSSRPEVPRVSKRRQRRERES